MKYLLTIQHEYEADDDPAARKKAEFLIANGDFWTAAIESKPEIKLRCIYDNMRPRTINLNPAEPLLKVRHVEIVKTHSLQCCYCKLEEKSVEAGGIFYCPNPLCSGPGGHWFRRTLDSYALVDIDKHKIDQDEWEKKANEFLAARPGLHKKVRKLYENLYLIPFAGPK